MMIGAESRPVVTIPETEEERQALLPTRSSARRVKVKAGCTIEQTAHLDRTLRRLVIGQDQAVERIVCASSRLLSGLQDPDRPLLTALLLGPTGVGKTETARAMAEALFGSPKALTRVNCEEYAHGHEVSKLLGAPPGYVGSQIEPRLSQRNIDGPHRTLRLAKEQGAADVGDLLVDNLFEREDGRYYSIILFDEIEKADPAVWNALLGILEEGMLTLGNNEVVDFTRSIIVMTSNVGSEALGDLVDQIRVGFRVATDVDSSPSSEDVERAAHGAARAAFPLEFLNRFDETLVYQSLDSFHMDRILDKFVGEIHVRAHEQADTPILINLTPAAREWLVDAGTDVRYGARPLRRAVDRRAG